jgi:hypothetical protein
MLTYDAIEEDLETAADLGFPRVLGVSFSSSFSKSKAPDILCVGM